MKKYFKKWWIVFLLSVLVMAGTLPSTGCVTLGNNQDWRNNTKQLNIDIYTFSKLITRISLKEMKTPAEDVAVIEGYLIVLKDFLAVPGRPNFSGARSLVAINLPPKYTVYGFTIIDLLERYLSTIELNITEDQTIIISLISSGINGAIDAVQELSSN